MLGGLDVRPAGSEGWGVRGEPDIQSAACKFTLVQFFIVYNSKTQLLVVFHFSFNNYKNGSIMFLNIFS